MSFDQMPLGGDADIFMRNPEPRCPVVLLLDTSYSMAGAPIDELNAGLRVFRDELLGDALAAKRVEVAIVTFGPVKVESGFCGAESFVAPVLRETGDTPMGAAIECALDLVEDRRQTYKTAGIKHYKPWVFLISDGGPTDDWTNAARRVREANDKKALSFFAVGVEGADLATMAKISVRPPLKLDGLKFRELFVWLSGSLGAVSGSSPDDDHVALKDPTKGDSWAAA